jgi:hypothetical protein
MEFLLFSLCAKVVCLYLFGGNCFAFLNKFEISIEFSFLKYIQYFEFEKLLKLALFAKFEAKCGRKGSRK